MIAMYKTSDCHVHSNTVTRQFITNHINHPWTLTMRSFTQCRPKAIVITKLIQLNSSIQPPRQLYQMFLGLDQVTPCRFCNRKPSPHCTIHNIHTFIVHCTNNRFTCAMSGIILGVLNQGFHSLKCSQKSPKLLTLPDDLISLPWIQISPV